MHIVSLQAENFKILKAIEITPDGRMVRIGGKNGQGKSSVLDAVWVALAGKGVAPPKPIRAGEEECRLRLDLGEIVVTRRFKDMGDGRITDSVKVESADGKQKFNSPQAMLNELLGQIGFDPLAFTNERPEDQAQMLLGMVPLPIDLEELAAADQADFSSRREINRDLANLKGAIAQIIVPDDLPEVAPDRNALLDQLSSAADTNTSIERENMRRAEIERQAKTCDELAANAATAAAELAAKIERAKAAEAEQKAEAERLRNSLTELRPLPDPVDTDGLRSKLSEAEQVTAAIARRDSKLAMLKDHDEKLAKANALTAAMEAREDSRRKALAGAKMPIEGLGFAINEKGKPVVTFRDIPFEQISSADQIRASTAIAMAANPELRVLRIKDGSLLDDDSMAIIADMAEAEDFQLWVEVVGTGGVGIVIEDGSIKGQVNAPEPDQKGEPPAQGGLI